MPTDPLFILIAGAIAALFLGIILYFLYNLAQPKVTRKAKVVAKRTHVQVHAGSQHTTAHGTTYYYCTFEFENGERLEYAVGAGTYGLLVENDHGYLDTKGSLFWDFRRQSQP
jgi:hypothetical protein